VAAFTAAGGVNVIQALTHYNGDLIVGGNFPLAGGKISGFWARWGPTTAYGDLNENGKLDADDFGLAFDHGCITGPSDVESDPPASRECLCALNSDGDGDIDLCDFAAFQNAFAP